MSEMEYIGESLWAGQLGYALVFIAICGALLSALAYFFNTKTRDNSWQPIGRIAFRIHSFSIIGVIGLVFYLLINKNFEYYYVWRHSSSDLPLRYILSSFWEGQEGSFMLWLFWHVVLGNILIFTAKTWEGPVMAIFSIVQLFLTTMLLGVHIPEITIFGAELAEKVIGSNPFLLLRQHQDMIGSPFIQLPNYKALIDGNGLNLLLQNYWMTIHPPTLFLGFASTLVPFAYAIAGLWTKRYNEWLKPALPWSFFGVMIFGTGIE